MSKGEIEQKATLTRQETARWLADLATAIADGGPVELSLTGAPVTLHLADELRCELEIEPHGDTMELEIELKWSVPRAGRDDAPSGPIARSART
ncbi:amphi-Trp domain-containing protein [Actinomycetospora sp. C-140]